MKSNFSLTCPFPINEYPHVLLAHGGGGKLMHSLIEKMFATFYEKDAVAQLHDSAVLDVTGKIAFTTDSYVVSPLFFPGGDIGSLAVNGTVNDLAVSGAKPLYITVAFILEEGFPMAELWRIVQSLATAAKKAKVRIVTGDTKVVEKGKGDGVYINTAGVGVVTSKRMINAKQIEAGDQILLSGDIGRHGTTIMAQREGLTFESSIESDCAPLADMISALLEAPIDIHCMRDLTRGGLASATVELAQASKKCFILEEQAIPVCQPVRAACEMLGLDPIYIANEGCFIAFIPQKDAEQALRIIKAQPNGCNAAIIGSVNQEHEGLVSLLSMLGTKRIVDMISGEQLPRIC